MPVPTLRVHSRKSRRVVGTCSERFPNHEYLSKEHVCVAGIFSFPNPGGGVFRCLEPFWARLSVCRAQRADHRCSVTAGDGPPTVNKVPSATPPPAPPSGRALGD